MFRNTSSRTAAGAVVVAIVAVLSPPAAAEGAAPAPPEHPLDAGPVDVAAISLTGSSLRLSAEDGTGLPHDPESLVYTATPRPGGVEVGWDTSGITPGTVFGDTVTLPLRTAAGPDDVEAEPLRLPVGERGTTTWTFPAPGRYTLTVAVEAHLLTGEPVDTAEGYTVAVRGEAVDAPPTEPPPASSPPAAPESSPPAATPLRAAPLAARAQPAPTTPGQVVLAEGHVDAVAPRLLDGALQIQVKDGTTVGQSGGQVRWREPGNVVFQVRPGARTALPDDPALAFLGAEGDEIFLLPQQQQAGILWTGWSTEELRANQVRGPVTWRLTEVDGPGAFGIFTTGSFGDSTVIFDSTDGLPDSHSVALGTHAHANWGFAEQGVYRLTFDVTARLTDGRTVSDTEVYTFAVGDVDPDSALSGGSGGGAGSGGGDDSGGAGGGPGLAYTGVGAVLPLAAGGALLLGLGGIALLAARGRRAGTGREVGR